MLVEAQQRLLTGFPPPARARSEKYPENGKGRKEDSALPPDHAGQPFLGCRRAGGQCLERRGEVQGDDDIESIVQTADNCILVQNDFGGKC